MNKSNNQIHLTVKSATFFAGVKIVPLFMPAEVKR